MGEAGIDYRALWRTYLHRAVNAIFMDPAISPTISISHYNDSPARVVQAWEEMFSGCSVDTDKLLSATFPSDGYNEMVHVKHISFYSVCAHHLVPFFGTAHFAYIPEKEVVGLSKIPRLIDAYSRRPQVQEKLTTEIVDKFNEIIKPKGCGLIMRGYHFCMISRGVREPKSFTETTALRGCFADSASTKSEFLLAAQTNLPVWG